MTVHIKLTDEESAILYRVLQGSRERKQRLIRECKDPSAKRFKQECKVEQAGIETMLEKLTRGIRGG